MNNSVKNSFKRLDIKLGFICNNHCLHCAQGNKRNIFGNKSFKQLKNELKEGSYDCKQVVFTGGEPTIHKDFLDLISYARKLGFTNIQIQTNGRMFVYERFCKEVIDAGANDFCLAVIGHNSRVHDYLSSTKGSFKQTTYGIRNLKYLGVHVSTNTVISKLNYRHLPAVSNLLVELGVDQFQFAFPHPCGKAGENFLIIVPRMRSIISFVKKGLDIGIKAGKVVMTEAIPYCLMSGYEVFIAERAIPESIVFDVDYKVDNYSEYRKNQAKLKGSKCHLCKYYNVCEGPWREYPERFGWGEFIPILV